ncbi:MAG TPA: ATP-binding protein [Planctomycetaceae bacterium]|nr:ATP-binding protein [Planctomycetaceae bacterium]
MRVRTGDSVFFVAHPRRVGVVVSSDGGSVTLRLPSEGNKREVAFRKDVNPLAEAMYESRANGTGFRKDISLTGDSTLADLVGLFGYPNQRIRKDSLDGICKQLRRAGLHITAETDQRARDEKFILTVAEPESEVTEDNTIQANSIDPSLIAIPDPFWPTALGLAANQEITFLRALCGDEALLCLLHLPGDREMEKWLQATWEGTVSWAFHSAQRFHFSLFGDNAERTVCRGTSELLHSFLKVSVLGSETPQLSTQNHSLNLVTLQKESDVPVGFENVKANWPGLVFEFEPKPPISGGNSSSSDKFVEVSADEIALVECLLLASGIKREQRGRLCPLKTLIWARSANPQILSRSASAMGAFFSSEKASKFKGSNESGKALALKADVARWIRQTDPNAKLNFESTLQTKASGAEMRIDLHVEGHGQFEIETMNGSGPIEAFYHQKVFSRLSGQDESFRLVVPNDAVLWAGLYLADIAHHLGNRGKVLIPSADGTYLEIEARALLHQSCLEIPWDELRPTTDPTGSTSSESAVDTQIRLADVAGYKDVRDRIDELVIWPEQHRSQMSGPSRTSGILLFGPPGCGKSRLARAIAGELEQEVRLLTPSDLRGAYVGWGQILIKEQFNWVAAGANRMLVFDELDAIARSRRGGEGGWMISDEMADVNELLVQLDRVTRLGRIVVGTTNYIATLIF